MSVPLDRKVFQCVDSTCPPSFNQVSLPLFSQGAAEPELHLLKQNQQSSLMAPRVSVNFQETL